MQATINGKQYKVTVVKSDDNGYLVKVVDKKQDNGNNYGVTVWVGKVDADNEEDIMVLAGITSGYSKEEAKNWLVENAVSTLEYLGYLDELKVSFAYEKIDRKLKDEYGYEGKLSEREKEEIFGAVLIDLVTKSVEGKSIKRQVQKWWH